MQKIVCFLLVTSLFFCFSFVQAQNATQSRHETLNQNSIDITLDATTVDGSYATNGWIITVGGSPATITNVVVVGTLVRVTFTPAVGIGETVFVDYNSGVAGATTPISNIVGLQSFNNWNPVCDDFAYNTQGNSPDPCSPVDPTTYVTFTASARARNSSLWNLANYSTRITWGDPGNTAETLTLYESDGLGNASPNSYILTANSQTDGTFIYPTGQTVCSFTSLWRVRINGIGNCNPSSANQTITYSNFDTDDQGSGVLALNETVANTRLVCLNEDADMYFEDNSTYNCLTDPFQAHNQTRWVRVIYGDPANANRIPNIFVDGVQVTDNTGALMPAFAATGYFPTGTGGAGNPGAPDANGVMENSSVVTGPIGQLLNITTTGADASPARDVGDTFVVTIEYWNRCNPYDGSIFTLGDAVSTTNELIIIDAPTDPVPVDKNICTGDPAQTFEFTAASTAGSTAINWYEDAAGTIPITNSLGVNSRFLPDSDYPFGVVSAAGTYTVYAAYIIGATNNCESNVVGVDINIEESPIADLVPTQVSADNCGGGTYDYDASGSTYVAGSTFFLEIDQNNFAGSNNVEVGPQASDFFDDIFVAHPNTNNTQTFDLRLTITSLAPYSCTDQVVLSDYFTTKLSPTTTATNNTPDICSGETTDIVLSSNANTKGQTHYDVTVLSVVPGGFAAISGESDELNQGHPHTIAQTLTNNSGADQTVTYQIQSVNESGSGSDCDGSIITRTVIVRSFPSDADLSIDDVLICSGDNTDLRVTITGGTGPYSVTITDDQASSTDIGTVTSYNSGDPINTGGLTASTNYTLTSVTDANGCNAVLDITNVSVTIGNPTDAVISGDASICSGNSTDLTVTITGGTGPFDFDITDNQASSPDLSPIVGYTSGDPIATGALTATTIYTLSNVVDNNGCPVLGISDATATIQVGSTPTDAAIAGATTICDGGSASISVTINGGAPPYTVTIDNGVGAVGSYTSGSAIDVTGLLSVGANNFNLTSVEDACGSSVPGGSLFGNAQTITVESNPNDVAVTAVPGTVCSDGGGVDIRIATSEADVDYQLQEDSGSGFGNVGVALTGNGGDLDLPTGNLVSATDDIYTYRVIATRNVGLNCSITLSDEPTVDIEALPADENVTSDATAVCSGGNADITIANSSVIVLYQLQVDPNTGTFGDIGAPSVGNGGNLDLNTGALINAGPAVITYNYRVVATNTGGLNCTFTLTDIPNVDIEPNPNDETVIAVDPTVCSNSGGTSIRISNSEVNVDYQLQEDSGSGFGNVGAATAGNGGNLDLATGNLVSATDDTYTYRVIATKNFGEGCSITLTDQPTVDIEALPSDENVTSDATAVCNGGSADITIANSSATVSYQLQVDPNTGTFGDIGAPSVGNGGNLDLNTGALINAGPAVITYNYRVVATNTGGLNCTFILTDIPSIDIEPNPNDVTVIAVDPTVCSDTGGTNIRISSSETNVDYQLQEDSGSGFGNIGAAITGNGGTIDLPTGNLLTVTDVTYNYRVIATKNFGENCSIILSDQPTVDIFELPTSAITPDPAQVAANTIITLDGNPTGGDSGPYVNHSWNIIAQPGGSTFTLTPSGSSVDFQSPDNGIFTLEYIFEDGRGCSGSDQVDVQVSPLPTPDILPVSLNVCVGDVLNLDGNPSGGTPPYVTHLWTGPGAAFLDDVNIQNPTFTPPVVTGVTTYSITYEVTDNAPATGSDTRTITVNPLPVISGINGANEVCTGDIESYIVPGGNPAISTFTWDLSGLGTLGVDYNVNTGGTPTQFVSIEYLTVQAGASIGVTQTVNSTGCETSATLTGIDVYGLPAVVLSSDDADLIICNGDQVTFTAIDATGFATRFDFYRNGVLVQSGASNTYGPLTDLASFDNITVNGSVNGKCLVSDGPIAHTVNSIPGANAINSTVCSDAAGGSTYNEDLTTLEATINGGAVTFTWWENYNSVTGVFTNQISSGAAAGETQNYDLSNGVSVYARVDNGTCDNAGVVTYTVNPLPSIVANVTIDVSCNGGSDGQITALAADGTAPYQYSIDGTNYFTSNVFNGLTAGSYTVRARDVNNCEASQVGVMVTEPVVLTASGVVSTNFNGQDVSCNGDFDGGIDLTVAGGTAPYSYSWTGPNAYTNFVDEDPIGLEAGTYDVTVTDVNGCITTTSVVISEPVILSASGAVSTNYNGQDISCNGDFDGGIDITVAGGTAPFSYSWTGPNAYTNLVDEDPTGLEAGAYDVTVTDVNGCITTTTVIITEPVVLNASGVVSTNYNGQDISCNGDFDGGIDLTVVGGTAPFNYSWTGPNAYINVVDEDPTGLEAGTYDVTITDANGCMTTASVTLTEPVALGMNITPTDILCNGNSTGAISVTGIDGTGPYQYNIDGGAFFNSGSFSSLAANSYTIGVRDANGCIANQVVVLSEPTTLSLNVTPTDVTCNGAFDGELLLVGGGGVGPYEYSVNGSAYQTSGLFTGLSAGSYTALVRDANLCVKDQIIVLSQPTLLNISLTITSNYNGFDISCFGAGDAEITAVASGGTGGYTFTFIDDVANTSGDATGIYSGVFAGSYRVRVEDATGCTTDSAPISVSFPFNLNAGVVNGTQALCQGEDPNEFIELASPFGGIGNYSYQWERSSDNFVTDINDVAGATGTTLDLAAADISSNTYFRRRVESGTCSPVYSNRIFILIHPQPVMTPPAQVTICDGDFVNEIFVSSQVGTSFTWDVISAGADLNGYANGSGPGIVQRLFNTGNTAQIIEYEISYSANSCPGASTELLQVTVNPDPIITNLPASVTICNGDELNYPLTSNVAGVQFIWDVDDSNTLGATDDTGNAIVQTLTNTTTTQQTIMYEVVAEGLGACPNGSPLNLSVIVNPQVDAVITTTDVVFCNGESVPVDFVLSGKAPFKLKLTGMPVINNVGNTYSLSVIENSNINIQYVEDENGCRSNPNQNVNITFEDAIADFEVRGADAINTFPFTDQNTSVNLDFNSGQATVRFRINNFDANNIYSMRIGDVLLTDDEISANFEYTFTEPSDFGTLGFLVEIQVQSPSDVCDDVSRFYIEVIPATPKVIACIGDDCNTVRNTNGAVITEPEELSDINPELREISGCAPLTVDFYSFVQDAGDLLLSRNIDPLSIEWTIDGNTIDSPNPTYTFTQGGTYSIELTAQNGYNEFDFDAVTVIVYSNPTAQFIITQSVVYIPDDGFRPTNRSQGADEFLWDFGDFNTSLARTPEHFYEEEGVYEVTLIASKNHDASIVCRDTLVQEVIVEEGGFTKTPNAFTPNLNGPSGGAEIDPNVPGSGDLANDVFLPITVGVEDFKMWIYDRWGNLIFYSDNKRIGWDGYDSKGNLLPAGVYVYKLDLILSSGQRTTRVGDVTLIR